VIESSIRLSSGRRLDYSELGPADSPVVLYFHGTPGSRLELLLARAALERHGGRMRLIGLNRPGYGKSSFVPYGGFLPWASIVDEAADRLGLDRFAVLGASGGSPFALACAYSLADRVNRVGIVAGVAPPETPGMNRAAALAEEHAGTIMRSVRYGALCLATRVGLTRLLTSRLISSLGPADQQAMRDPVATNSLERVVWEAFAQWGRAAVLEAGLFMRPWDFDPALVTRQIRLWHGTEDTRIPVEVASSFADRMRHADCVLWPSHGHFSWAMSDEIASIAEFLTG
jgi:pimeloyl-ACP methyl ester carboxylesterase